MRLAVAHDCPEGIVRMDFLQSAVDFLQATFVDFGISTIGGEQLPVMVILLLGAGLYLTHPDRFRPAAPSRATASV